MRRVVLGVGELLLYTPIDNPDKRYTVSMKYWSESKFLDGVGATMNHKVRLIAEVLDEPKRRSKR